MHLALTSRARSIPLTDTMHVICALAAGLIPLAVFVILSYHQAIRRAEVELTNIVEVALERAEEVLNKAETALARFVRVTEGRLTPTAERLLREIAYTEPYFREAGIVDEQGYLVYSTAVPVETPIDLRADHRAAADRKSLQIVGRVRTRVMQEESIVLALPTQGQGEVNLLVDPAVLSLFFNDVELGATGSLAFIGPEGQALSVVGNQRLPDGAWAPDAEADRVRVTRTTDDGQVQVIGQIERAWALRDWSANLLYSIPVAGLSGCLLAYLMIRLIKRRSGLDHDLRLGIRRDELRVEYQPIMELNSGQCVAAEALLRWRHPVHGDIRPDLFIPLAEETGLIGPLTEWLLRRVLQEQGPLLEHFPELRLTINCASSLLSSRELEEILGRVVVPADLTPKLVFEVTENVFAGHGAGSAREAMTRLRHNGFRFALDDFGAGYAGFGYLHKFEFEFLKIDRSFVQAIGTDVATTSIFDTLVDLAARLGMVTVAEGVETEEQRHHISRRGVGFAQGWLFATALPVSDLADFLAEARAA